MSRFCTNKCKPHPKKLREPSPRVLSTLWKHLGQVWEQLVCNYVLCQLPFFNLSNPPLDLVLLPSLLPSCPTPSPATAAPPDYYSLFGQIREARQQSGNSFTFLSRVSKIILSTGQQFVRLLGLLCPICG